ncbi:MAG: glutamine-hydrolyzing carbamoyl-phosphate synthase small subunit [Chitinivibrionales bacterium]|nr:glutamine-hydrolyzing carbamoyl-phosphate synthase small subunit [Chitinivibrionales bacterium]
MKGYVALEDGTVFKGQSFGSEGLSVGEVVFNTSMMGYQEILTDPSYCQQIVTMTYPLIGNYGCNSLAVESKKVQVAGFIVKEACRYPSNFTSEKTIADYLKEYKIVAIEGIDTRALTRHIRVAGAMKGCIAAGDNLNEAALVQKARAWVGLVGVDIVKNVTCDASYNWDDISPRPDVPVRFNVVAFDFGIKYNILRLLQAHGCAVKVVPANTPAEAVLKENPDGVFLSNGPGDPAAVTYAIKTIGKLVGRVPIFGICLGHQLLALALGGKTYKLKFGHRGANHPVKNCASGAIEITAQNHGFCADLSSLADGATLTHENLNDHTCEGLADLQKRCFSVQYHPEASPGPHDSQYLFQQFITMMEKS